MTTPDTNLLFGSDQGNAGAPQTNESNEDYLAMYVGEGKRYKDVAALAKGAKDKDDFIERLKQEAAAARSALRGEQKIDEFLDKLKSVNSAPGASNTQVTTPDGTNTNQPTTQPQTPTQKALTPAEVEELLEQREARKNAEANLKEAQRIAQAAFGANYPTVLSEKADELGVSKEYLTNLAANSPAAFARLIGAEGKQEAGSGLPRTQVNSAALRDATTGAVKNGAYYKQLRKQIGDAEFFKPGVQNELFRQIKVLGDAF